MSEVNVPRSQNNSSMLEKGSDCTPSKRVVNQEGLKINIPSASERRTKLVGLSKAKDSPLGRRSR